MGITGATVVALGMLAFSAAAQSELPDAPGKEAVEKVCSNCHALAVITQNRGSQRHWEATVDDMVSRGAEATDEEIEQVVKYLVANFGPIKININKADAAEIVKALSFSNDEAKTIVDYRAKNGPFKDLDALKAVPHIDAKKLDANKESIEF
ncbi:MAG TPA: helix-hairpin-helix domain-containing protein [Verrucomicrobiae bacterium]|nr:helix-hairpin-helix domain-containing protein [Verrucomicrobiae bacterium]